MYPPCPFPAIIFIPVRFTGMAARARTHARSLACSRPLRSAAKPEDLPTPIYVSTAILCTRAAMARFYLFRIPSSLCSSPSRATRFLSLTAAALCTLGSARCFLVALSPSFSTIQPLPPRSPVSVKPDAPSLRVWAIAAHFDPCISVCLVPADLHTFFRGQLSVIRRSTWIDRRRGAGEGEGVKRVAQ